MCGSQSCEDLTQQAGPTSSQEDESSRITGTGGTSIAITPPGVYSTYYEVNKWDVGPLGGLYRPKYFNRGIAVHGSYSVPPYPASHGCVRVSLAAMDWIWLNNMMPRGTKVVVYK